MRIGFAYDSAYPWFNGGIEKRRFLIMQELQRAGHEIHCFTMYREGMKGMEFEYKGVHYHCVGMAVPKSSMYKNGRRNMSWPIKYAALLPLKIIDYKFDIIDADAFPFLHIPKLAAYARLTEAKFVVTWHEVWDKGYWKGYLKTFGALGYLAEKISARLSSNVIANTSQTKEDLTRIFGVPGGKIQVFPAAISRRELEAFARKNPRKPSGRFIVIGRLVPEKRVDLAIRAVAKTSAGLTVIGSGPEKQRLLALAKELGASGRVRFIEGVKEEQLIRELRNSLALLMLSEREGMSIITIEALALGVPVVVTGETSLPFEIKRYCHKVSAARLGAELGRMARDKRSPLRKKGASSTQVLERFSAERAPEIYLQIKESGE
ncbi:MAG: glycosyltransferase family 4 protein [Candidatus Micrarchaeota archaeon]|nr:glycosyltransferase family 4 protein [Candidatus Micrarchaeota archaeon]